MEVTSQNSSSKNRSGQTEYFEVNNSFDQSDTEINADETTQALKDSSQMVSVLYQEKPTLKLKLEVASGISELDEEYYDNQSGSSRVEESQDARVTKKRSQSCTKGMHPLLQNTKTFLLSPTKIRDQKVSPNKTTDSLLMEIDQSSPEKNNSLNQSQFQSPLRKNRLIGSQARFLEDDDKNQAVLKIQSFYRRLIAEKPEIPECYEGLNTHYKYPISAPEKDDKFVCIGNRQDFSVGWYRIGAKIDKYSEVLGSSTTNLFADREPKVFQADDHNKNLPDLSLASTEELKVQLRAFGLSEEGNRVDLFKRLVDAKESNQPRATRRINTTALIGVLGVMTILFAAKKRYGTISPMGIWKQIRSKPPVPQQKV